MSSYDQPRWRRYLRFWGPDVAADVDDEIRFHLAQLERHLIASGLDPADAREEARARFGDPDTVARWLRTHDSLQLRRSERVDALGDLLQDARYALRRLRAAPAFTLAVVLVLAAGIGATTSIFGVIDVALLRALPYLDPDRLVVVRDLQGEDQTPASFPEYLDWQRPRTSSPRPPPTSPPRSRSPAAASRRCSARRRCRPTCRGCSASSRASDARSHPEKTTPLPIAW